LEKSLAIATTSNSILGFIAKDKKLFSIFTNSNIIDMQLF